LRFADARQLADGSWRVVWQGPPGKRLSLSSTSTLSAPAGSWSSLGELPEVGTGIYVFNDRRQDRPVKLFYRAANL